ncbi:energy-coupling factor transporter transmembrane protein EcfT [Bradyrhizobium sp. U87765 SZCCT0131]|uniref:CbiQ family ECF transporter T component n=1 Tax=unclassified Bradyrhizobium TaxID=2631580 RepID=UPI001BAE3DD8|nr:MULTISPECIES: CbiQ family ECF transporter T component [unclassified Bradyrhizobium]MBR1217039.1 energy-coupling factor transporter transmembrane protein EcfT [Bradyrhizobium sp. U87765 SZCCT0131]MBR1259205.1 energy-coupling factor transporter transmembrane protein EcfT [Bradyrhizobium sp. U87765 SZCCT0134]MBR1305346.1 energy-coupling factor transporter transmembrane protein EcfT [Bradyrhizobium sp. U87765 SZCCT0110]MBR1321132.1 energy-coupling factor transporter transmembrane protein EcfT [B
MMGGYLARATWLHRLPAWLKLAALAAISLALLPVQDWRLLALSFAAVIAIYAMLGRDALRRLGLFRPLIPLLVIVGGLQGLFNQWQDGAVVVLRLVVMVLAADLVTMTTTMTALMAAVEPLFRLLRPLGVDARKIALAVALVLRFIPVLLANWRAREEAWRARSQRRPPLRMVVLFLAETLRLADHVAEALDARGFGRPHRPT